MKNTHFSTSSFFALSTSIIFVFATGCGGGKKSAPIAPTNQSVLDSGPPTNMQIERQAPDSKHNPKSAQPILGLLAKENARWFSEGKKADVPIHYLSHQVFDRTLVVIEAQSGSIITDEENSERQLDTQVRVGNARLDNFHSLGDKRTQDLVAPMSRRGGLPWGEDPEAIRSYVWLDTDRRFREAQLAYRAVQMDVRTRGDKAVVPDFLPAEKTVYIEAPKKLSLDKEQWKTLLKDCSRTAHQKRATRGSCQLRAELQTSYFVNSEGSRIQQSTIHAMVSVSSGVKALDGMPLSRLEQRFSTDPSELANQTLLGELANNTAAELTALHDAPVAEPFAGPAILQGRAAGVFFHEVFGHRIEGHRQEEHISGQTFATKVNKPIMPAWLSIYDDPTISRVNNTPVNGLYRFDDEGVVAQKAPLVENGILKGFVQGRNAVRGHLKSNGHGRKSPGRTAVSRQGNLVVQAARTMKYADLEKALLEQIRKTKKPYGLIITDISGGFTNTTQFAPQSFKVQPTMAYRLYPDGKKELVRGIDISGTPLVALESIMAASTETETFNGMCGAESGWVPVSASAPSILVKSLEVEKAFKGVYRPPILGAPDFSKTAEGK